MESQSVTLLSDGQIKSLFRNEKPDPGFVLSTVSVADVQRMRWSSDSSLNARVQRCTQWIAICARFKARFNAGQTIRLMREARSAKKRGATWKRVEGKARLKYLRSPLVGKAAGHAMGADDIEEVTDHPVLDLLRQPNPFTTGHAFALSRFMDLEVAGNGFVYYDKPNQPNGAYRLAPHKTAVIPSRDSYVQGYRYGTGQDIKVDFPSELVDHFKFMPGLGSPYLGDSWVQDVILDADRYAASTQSDLALQTRGGRPDWVMKLPPGSNAETVKQAREEIKRRLGGTNKAGEVLFTTAEEITPLQWRPKDLEAIASREDAKLIICNAAGVPETMMAMQNANRAGADAGLIQFARMTALPQLAQDAGELTDMLLPRFPGTEGYWFVYDNPVPDDEAAEVDCHVKLVGAGLMTLNQSLAERGYDQIGEEGDVYRVNGIPLANLAAMPEQPTPGVDTKPADQPDAAAVPGGDVQATALNGAQVTALQDLLQSVADGKIPIETARAAIAASYPTLTEEQIERMVGPLANFEPKVQESSDASGGVASNEPSDVADGSDGAEPEGGAGKKRPRQGKQGGERGGVHPAFSAGWDAKCLCCKSATDLNPAQSRALTEIEQACRTWFNGLDPKATDVTGEVRIPPDAAKNLVDLLRGPMAELVGAASTAAGSEAGAVVTSESALKYLETYLPKLAQQITLDTRVALSDAVRGGISGGESIGEIQDRVARALGDQTNYRAERIARTEVSNVYNRGKMETWKSVDPGMKKRWLLAPGACEFCEAVAKKNDGPVPMDHVFVQVGETVVGTEGGTLTNSWQPVLASPLHPNDFCAVIPVVE